MNKEADTTFLHPPLDIEFVYAYG